MYVYTVTCNVCMYDKTTCKYTRTLTYTYAHRYLQCMRIYDMTDSTENATRPKCVKSRNSNSLVQIQIEPESQSVLRDTEKSESLSIWWISGVEQFLWKLS